MNNSETIAKMIKKIESINLPQKEPMIQFINDYSFLLSFTHVSMNGLQIFFSYQDVDFCFDYQMIPLEAKTVRHLLNLHLQQDRFQTNPRSIYLPKNQSLEKMNSSSEYLHRQYVDAIVNYIDDIRQYLHQKDSEGESLKRKELLCEQLSHLTDKSRYPGPSLSIELNKLTEEKLEKLVELLLTT